MAELYAIPYKNSLDGVPETVLGRLDCFYMVRVKCAAGTWYKPPGCRWNHYCSTAWLAGPYKNTLSYEAVATVVVGWLAGVR